MEESFELLSSMSPKVKHCQKHFRKGTTVLALRKSLRRSSFYDKSVHTKYNDELVITESSSTTVSSSSNSNISKSVSMGKSSKKLLNRTPISIHDSDSDIDKELEVIPNKNLSPRMVKESSSTSKVKYDRSLLPEDKFENIKHWLDEVNLQSGIKDSFIHSAAYTELSTICGEENNANFVTERLGRAVNSTAIGSESVHFEQLFKKKTDNVFLRNNIDDNEISDEDVIDESFVIQNTSIVQKSNKNKTNSKVRTGRSQVSSSDRSATSSSIENHESDNFQKNAEKQWGEIKNDFDNCFSLNESLKTRLLKKKKKRIQSNNIANKTSNKITEDRLSAQSKNEELASLLDDLYGDTWRVKEDHVLPKTEPRKQKPKIYNIPTPSSERKPKLSVLYKNPYLDTEKWKSRNLLQTLQISRLKDNIESPMVKRLNEICDSDSTSNTSGGVTNPRMKLNFNDSDTDDDCRKAIKNEGIKSKYFKKSVHGVKKVTAEPVCKENESDKENLGDFSFLGQTLEERLRKKLKGINKVSSKNSTNKTPITKKLEDNNYNKVFKTTEKGKQKTDNGNLSSSGSSSNDEWDKEISKILNESKPVNGRYSFLASLSTNIPILQCDMSARIYRNNFKSYKDQLLKKLFKLFNEKVFENALPHNTLLEWNDRMRGTAGFCYCKKITRKTGAIERTVRIVLSTKVIDAAYRLRDTLIHEMCHAATWIVNCVSDGHGPFWKAWAFKAMKTFPELPPIQRCHDYVINTKYTYKCTGCGYSIGRHSKSLDIERKRCGHCLGKFEVLLNKVSKKGETKSVPATPKKEVTGFALFVKENYNTYKQTNTKHGEVMKLLGQKFQEMKLKKVD